MSSYCTIPGVDTGVRSTSNSANVRGYLLLRLVVVGDEAGILLEEAVSPADGPRFVAIYFRADDLGALIGHLQAMQVEYEARRHFLDARPYKLDA
jgi:hypothetical protein